jgi:transposase
VARRDLAGAEKKARREGRTIVLVDESGFYLLPGVVRTYAPCGETPVLKVFETRDHLSAMSGITPAGQLATLIRGYALTSAESVLFLRHLRCYVADRLLVIRDGSPIHRSRAVKSYLANGGAPAVHLERLPAYAPDLNPDEGVWQHLKRVEPRNLCCADLDDLHHELRLAISRLRQKPQLIQSFFARVGLDI